MSYRGAAATCRGPNSVGDSINGDEQISVYHFAATRFCLSRHIVFIIPLLPKKTTTILCLTVVGCSSTLETYTLLLDLDFTSQ